MTEGQRTSPQKKAAPSMRENAADERAGKSDRLYHQLLVGIIDGEWAAGHRLPPERDLARRFSAGRAAVREALKRLVQAGLLSTVQGGGSRVEDFRHAAGLDLLAAIALAGAGERKRTVMRGVIELRTLLLVDAARHAALRHTEHQLATIRQRVASLAVAGDDAALAAGLSDVWDAIVDASANLAYRLAVNSLRDGSALFGKPLHRALRDTFHAPDYRVLLEALAAHDTQRAERAARRILEKDAAMVVERFGF